MHNDSPSRETVRHMKELYPAGCRVELIEMDDPYTHIPEGTRGTVIAVDDIASVHIRWDTGSTLAAAYGIDRIRRIPTRVCPRCGRTYEEHPALSRADNATEICPACGMAEALEAAGLA